MDTKDLRCFCRVYEERGINQAAKQLFISPQGLSRIIAKLEAELQVALFKRSARGLCPTAGGSYLYESCQELLNRLEDLEIGIRRIERMDKELQLGFSCGVLNVFPFHKLERFKTENPDIQLQREELENQEVIDRIFSGSLTQGLSLAALSGTVCMQRKCIKAGWMLWYMKDIHSMTDSSCQLEICGMSR
ncbi:MAG: LysR family transcriptional regulator [Eubacterium sp.]|nr:LysR family transcriptional regulator [Eubacterium sp.]